MDDGEQTDSDIERQITAVQEFQAEKEEDLNFFQPLNDVETSIPDHTEGAVAAQKVDNVEMEVSEKQICRSLKEQTSIINVNENLIGSGSEARIVHSQPSFGFGRGRVRRAREELDQEELEILSVAEQRSSKKIRQKILRPDQSLDQFIPSLDHLVCSRDIQQVFTEFQPHIISNVNVV